MAPPTPGPDLRPLVHEVARLGGDLSQVWPEVDERLRPILGYDSSTFSTIDPPTLNWTSRSVVGMDSSGARELKARQLEFRGDDLNSFPNLLMQQMSVGSLYTASGGNLSRSIRYDALLRELDLTDELRAVVRSEGLNWGILTLYRKRGKDVEPFVYKEQRAVRDALEPLAELVRLRMLQSAAEDPGDLDRPPGFLRVSAEGVVEETTPAAAARLESVDDPSAIPAAVAQVVADFKGGDALAHATLPAGSEGSVTLHASTGADGQLAIVVEEDRLVLLHQKVVDGFGFTEAEMDVLPFYVEGRTTRTIAQILVIDAFTIQDHLMSILKKTGTQNRADFLATLYAEHYEEKFEAGARPSPYGYFLD
jgi:DNA-binding CsgD family transcriptional regulator